MRYLVRMMVVLMTLSLGAVVLGGCEKQQADADGEHAEGEHAVVESGTYEGTIEKVNADEDEIYVDSDGQELELYFIEETTLTKGGEDVEFSALEKGQKVEVEIKKVGKRLDPLSVKILE